MAKPPKKPKDPAKPTRAKASRPDSAATPDALADLLNPAINKGTAGLGSGTGQNSGLQPPPDNSWDRRADFSNAHKARKSAQGFEEAPQRDYEAPPVTGLDPALAKELGLDGDQDTTPLPNPPPQGGREHSEQAADSKRNDPKYRLPRADLPTQPGGFAGFASQQSLDKLLREGRPEFAAQPATERCGRRTARRGRRNPKAGRNSSSSPTSSRKATSRTRSATWSRASGAKTARKFCWA